MRTAKLTAGVLGGVLWLGLLSAAPALAAAPEEPVTKPASEVTATSAVLHGELNPKTSATTGYDFTYGTEGTCEGTTTEPGAEATGKAIAVSTPGAGLEPNKEYTFCVVATHLENEVTESTPGMALTFKTSKAPPAVESESVSAVSSTDAQLEAAINPENEEVSYRVEYASKEAAGQLVGAKEAGIGTLPAGFGAQPVGPFDLGGALLPGKVYYYRAIAQSAAGEKTEGPIQSFTTLDTPVVTTGEAQNPTRTTVFLSGTIDPSGLETHYHFAYIPQASYEVAVAHEAEDPYAAGGSTPDEIAEASYETRSAGPRLTVELAPATTYDYALIASNALGATVGQPRTFTTSPLQPPFATTGPAEGVGQSATTISGAVETHGLPTIYGFETATEPGNFSPPAGTGSVGGVTTQTITLGLQGLQPGTTYYYRITATNSDGTSQGAPGTFTTSEVPSPLAIPPASGLIATPSILFPVSARPATMPKAITNAQKLAKALKTCAKKSKSKRAKCDMQAHKRYGLTKKTKK